MKSEWDTAEARHFLEAQNRREGGWCLTCGEHPAAQGELHCAECMSGEPPDDPEEPIRSCEHRPRCPRCGLLTADGERCVVCEYEAAHPKRFCFGPMVFGGRITMQTEVPGRHLSATKSGKARQVYEWRGTHRGAVA